jgi:hypothetical protein
MKYVSFVRQVLYRLILSAIGRGDLNLAWELLRALRRCDEYRDRTTH